MSTYLSKKTVGFYITVAAAILSIVGLVFYVGYRGAKTTASVLVAASIVVEVVLIVASKAVGNKPVLNLASTLSAVLLASGIMISLPSQIDGFGYLVAGLYSFDDMRNAIFFLIPGVIALVLYIIASFTDLGKE